MKRIIILLMTFMLLLTGCTAAKSDSGKIKIVAANFVCYDFARAVAGDKAEIKLLITPGSDMHSFEPTAKDIADIKNGDLFLYIGGESDTWADKILQNNDTEKNIKMIDCVTKIENEHGVDEHIWASPDNAVKMVNKVLEAVCKIDGENTDFYKKRAEDYIGGINAASDATKAVIQSAKKNTIVVADRFPLVYFTEFYGLRYEAAFGGCEHDTDPSLHTVTHLIDTVRNCGLTAVYRIELSNLSVADTVSGATGAEILELHSYQNVSLTDFNSGVTYIDIMKRNCEALRKGLN